MHHHPILFVLGISLPYALAWSDYTHSVIGAVAQNFLDQNGVRFVQHILRGTTLYEASSWAEYLQTRGKRYNELHFYFDRSVGAIDSTYPPMNDQCRYDPERDCLNGKCLPNAIGKYTDVFQCARRQSPHQLSDALMFLVHYVGDAGHPFLSNGHDNGRKDQQVYFEGKSATFNQVWDYYMPNRRIHRDFHGNIMNYAYYLTNQIHSNSFSSHVSTWAPHRHVYERSQYGLNQNAIDWATDTAVVTCQYIWPMFEYMKNQDLGESYYYRSVNILDMQIAKGGYRLASYINRMAAMTNGGQCTDFYSGNSKSCITGIASIAVPLLLALAL
ncbi:hypothetical protein BATDEDRAFT_86667 [Batrachochytrium dendrobatidis JAM81]|uniref:Uncharacterized protein n=2 Tax=Batrachochytrium dendrobatidis TaxID=109871 RepID=F4NWK9_BATDJ|nr:uncharacterized protein BATDEDRAFT_86667 [Batrachochytrium dendrobatidis JAM81]EGF82500.1 hypothetical protein BATDEDRAFT_86667 [Batrachochytrium dendrobatidis JAM81]KAJ8328002.1 hypothetical protein O5D80_003388 [Batrachochytrium dendrobatidis]KAK5667052.1 hypothetical protein QVD99_006268 [Batrachochytrium dendrobatidis]OAJ39512.1 hypothetical protein BDEG_23351 [Batrachochytrium dendrobatidis JEL423]|eukprot:XP_006676946.1 hypothetical protein BATDEDRAFT_86667 [Batrachochytrium dendrobatidis JAM81]